MNLATFRLRHGIATLREPLSQAAFLLKVQTGAYASAPHGLKMRILKRYLPHSGSVTLVETGTYFGDTVAALKDVCSQIVSIEIDPGLHEYAQWRFRSSRNVRLVLGDCATELPSVLATIKGPAAFWLDGHWRGGITSRGALDDPILLSLQQIREYGENSHVLLIDDARCFDGRESRPHLGDVIALLRSINPDYRILIHHDIISAVPQGPKDD